MISRMIRGLLATNMLLVIASPIVRGAMDESEKPAVVQSPPLVTEKAEQAADKQASVAHAHALSQAFRSAAAKMLPSVVTVRARMETAKSNNGILRVLESEEHEMYQSLGSGVIISADGLVMTNNHVVANAQEVQVQLSSGREYFATDIRTDPRSDLAILRLDTEDTFQGAEIGNSDDLIVGDWVLAIGSPFELDATVSAGIISRKGSMRGRGSSFNDLVKGQFLQTDAAVNPGNSGGPLVNLEGKLVGINTAISSLTGTFMGVGFAIPVNRAKWVKDELQAHGKVRRARLGVGTDPLPQHVADEFNIPARRGAYVKRVRDGSPAEKAGVKFGDVLVELADQRISSNGELAEIVEQCPVGQPLKLVLLRQGQRMELIVDLEAEE